MKQSKLIGICSAAFLLGGATFTAYAQNDESGYLMSLTEYTVKQGHGPDFQSGVTAYKECYLENDGEGTWGVWHRMQGEGTTYAVTMPSGNWADMAKDDPAGEACQDVAMEQIVPHIQNYNHMIVRHMPDVSTSSDDYSVVVTHNFIVNDGRTFNRIVEEIASIMAEHEGSAPGTWYNVIGGRDNADYFVAAQFKDLAALDDSGPGPWAIYEEHHGEEATNKLRSEFNEAVDEYWSYIYTLNDELSHTGSE